MRIFRGAGFTLLALTLLVGCDSEQPTHSGTQNASLDFASYTKGLLVDVWDRMRDTNGNGLPDAGDTILGIECGETYPPPLGPGGSVLRFPALWAFAAQVKVIHAGQVTAVQLLPASAAGYTNYPEWQDDTTNYPANPPIPDQPPNFDPSFVYGNPRRMINTSSDVMKCHTSVLPPAATLGGHPLPFTFTLEPGDTVVVTAGRDPSHPIDPTWPQFPAAFDAVLAIDGVIVTPLGTTTSEAPAGSISFSYQVR